MLFLIFSISSASAAGEALVFDPVSNVRASPNGSILCKIENVKKIEILRYDDNWFSTNACGKMGVIHKSQLKFTDVKIDGSEKRVTLKVATVFDPVSNVRDSPNGKLLCKIEEVKNIRVSKYNNEWFKTYTCGKLGYIHKSQISIENSNKYNKNGFSENILKRQHGKGWVQDNNGCNHYSPTSEKGDRIEDWTGSCENNSAEGYGTAYWYNGDNFLGQEIGRKIQGKAHGDFTYIFANGKELLLTFNHGEKVKNFQSALRTISGSEVVRNIARSAKESLQYSISSYCSRDYNGDDIIFCEAVKNKDATWCFANLNNEQETACAAAAENNTTYCYANAKNKKYCLSEVSKWNN